MSYSDKANWLDRFSTTTAMRLATVVGLLVILFFPITFPALAFVNWRERRRMRAAADATFCEMCSALLGHQAVDTARARARQLANERSKQNYGVREVYFGPEPDAICLRCGATYDFNTDTNELVLKLRRSIDGIRCPACQKFLNSTALDLANASRKQYWRERAADKDRVTARSADIICPHCQAEFDYDHRTREFKQRLSHDRAPIQSEDSGPEG